MSSPLAIPLAGIIVSILCYGIGVRIRTRFPFPVCNPFLIAAVLMIILMWLTPFSVEEYQRGGSVITLFLGPATAVLALRIYRQRTLLKANILPVLFGCLAGAVTSMASVRILCRVFALDDNLFLSLLPKSVTGAIALELSERSGGMGAVTIAAVLLTGVICVVVIPLFFRLIKLKDPVALGIALGTTGHAIGTVKALEIGEAEGAMSGLAMGLTAIITSVLYLFIF